MESRCTAFAVNIVVIIEIKCWYFAKSPSFKTFALKIPVNVKLSCEMVIVMILLTSGKSMMVLNRVKNPLSSRILIAINSLG